MMGKRTLNLAAFLLLAWAASGLLTHPASAYVLQGPHLLELMIEKMARARRFQVTQQLISHGAFAEEGSSVVTEKVSLQQPDSFRAEVLGQDFERIYVSQDGEAVLIVDGRTVSQTEDRFSRYKDIFLHSDRRQLTRFFYDTYLAAWQSSLGLFEGEVAYVIGAVYPDRSHSQLWLDQKTFLPRRLITVPPGSEAPEDVLDTRFSEWQRFGAIWYPMLMRFYQNDRLVREIRVEKVDLNPRFEPDLFNVPKLKLLNPLRLPPPADTRDTGGLNEVEETIDDFKRLYR